MESMVKQSIAIRRDVFMNTYEINNDALKNKIDDLFKRINAIGESAKDTMDFENKFMASPLNQEYNDLLMEVGMKCKAKAIKDINFEECEKPTIMDDAKRLAKRRVRDKIDNKLRDTPLGKIEQLDNMRYLFKRFTKK